MQAPPTAKSLFPLLNFTGRRIIQAKLRASLVHVGLGGYFQLG